MNDFSFDVTDGANASAFSCELAAGLPIPRSAAGRTALMLVKIGAVLDAIADVRLDDSGLDAREYATLSILAVDGPGSQHELSRLLGKAPGVVVAVVDALEDKGFVARQRDPQDRRRSIVTLTGPGQRALARADELADATVAELLGGLEAGELRTLSGLLERGLGLDGVAVAAGPAGAQRPASEPAASSRLAS